MFSARTEALPNKATAIIAQICRPNLIAKILLTFLKISTPFLPLSFFALFLNLQTQYLL